MRWLTLLALTVLSAGCSRRPPTAPNPGELVAIWDGRESGMMRVAAEALHCATDSLIEVLAFDDDQAVGLAIYLATAEPAAGPLAVMVAGQGEIPRPAAAAVFRAIRRDAVAGYQGRDGEVELLRADTGQLTGRFTVNLTELTDMEPINLRGAFLDLPVRPAPQPCGRRPAAAPAS